jgi:alanine racemase
LSLRISTSESARAWAEIDLDAVRHNTRALRSLLKHGAGLMAVVKSEAYGHGSVPVAHAALSAGAVRLGVNQIEEGLVLRDAGINVPIQLLTAALPEELVSGIEANLIFAASSVDEILALASRSRAVQQGIRRGCRTKLHLMIDTGMGRGGFAPEEVWLAVNRILAEKTLKLEGIFTHFSSAEEIDPAPTREQIQLFRTLLQACEDRGIKYSTRHAANSAGTVFYPEAHLDLVRCGVLLHGMRAWAAERDGLDLRPSLSLHTRIVHIARRPAGWTVGYNRLHVCRKESVLATLPVGYGDGYSRALSGRSKVIIRGVHVPVIGAISMNCIVADITALKDTLAGLPDVGDVATLIGGPVGRRINVEEIAHQSSTIPYAVTTQLGPDVERRYKCAGVETRVSCGRAL